MIKYRKPILFILLSALVTVTANGQKSDRINEDLAEKFNRYCEAVPRQEIYVHTDRNNYIGGEEIWFKVYLVDRISGKPQNGNTIVYFEVLNALNKPVAQKRIEVKGGFGNGMVEISDTLSSGEYSLRAYTNWMKNFLPGNSFIKDIKIYNALNTSRFVMKPNASQSDTLPALPRSSASAGFNADVNNLKPGILEINAAVNDKFREENVNGIYLFIQTHGVIDVNKTIPLSDDSVRIILSKKSLATGINHITLFNSREEVLFERYIYTPPVEVAHLTLIPPGNAGIRQKVTLELETDIKFNPSYGAMNLSVSIVPVSDSYVDQTISDYMVFGSEFGIVPDEIKRSNLTELAPDIIDSFLRTVKSNWINWNSILSGKAIDLKFKKEDNEHFLTGTLMNMNTLRPDSGRNVFLSIPGKTAGFRYSRTDKDGYFSFTIPIDTDIRDLIIQPEDVSRNNIAKILSPFSQKYLSGGTQPKISIQEPSASISGSAINYQVRKIYGVSPVGAPLPEISSQLLLKRFYGKPDITLIMDNYVKLPVMQEVFFELIPGVFLKSTKAHYDLTISDPVENRIYPVPPVLLVDGVETNDATVIANLDPEIVEEIDVIKSKYIVGSYLFYGIVNIITRAGDYSSVSLPDYAVRMRYRAVDPVNFFVPADYSSAERKQSRIPDFRNTLYWNPEVKAGLDGKIRIEFWTSDHISDYAIDIRGLTTKGEVVSFRQIIKVEK